MEAGLKNGLTVIGCGYAGFGTGNELAGSTYRIKTFCELLKLLDQAE